MTEDQFDQCPKCAAFPKFGLRCHPKFSVKAGINLEPEDGGNADMVAFYAHDEASARFLARRLSEIFTFRDSAEMILSVEHWDGDRWVQHTEIVASTKIS